MKEYGQKYQYLTKKEKQKLHEKQEEWRLNNDIDENVLQKLEADTIISAWMPLKMTFQYLYYQKSGLNYYPYKSNQYISRYGKRIAFFDYIEEEITSGKFSDKDNQLYMELLNFFDIASSEANIMLLKDRGMQSRGRDYLDQMTKTLYECFEGGRFYKFFGNSERKVEEWIREEKLTVFLKSGVISQNKILPLVSKMASSDYKWLSSREELLEMLENNTQLLKERKHLIDNREVKIN